MQYRILLAACFWFCAPVFAAGYAEHPDYLAFERRMVEQHGFDSAGLRALFAAAERKDSILEAISRPAEKRLSWGEYRQRFISASRISDGVAFWRENEPALARASVQFGVPAEIIVAIIGVETRFGANMGRYRVIDALSTLAFDYPPRSPFFSGELEQFLLMTREQKLDPLSLVGSYAGAMGLGQFMPTSFRHYAVDFDADGHTDIWNNRVDAIGSVANYFREHGWQGGGGVVVAAEVNGTVDESRMNSGLEANVQVSELAPLGLLPKENLPQDEKVLPMSLEIGGGREYWLGRHNFTVITRYNRSTLYAMAVYQLGQGIREEFTKR